MIKPGFTISGREDLKFKIDMYSDEIIKSVELNQMNLIKLSKESNQLKTNIENQERISMS